MTPSCWSHVYAWQVRQFFVGKAPGHTRPKLCYITVINIDGRCSSAGRAVAQLIVKRKTLVVVAQCDLIRCQRVAGRGGSRVGRGCRPLGLCYLML